MKLNEIKVIYNGFKILIIKFMNKLIPLNLIKKLLFQNLLNLYIKDILLKNLFNFIQIYKLKYFLVK